MRLNVDLDKLRVFYYVAKAKKFTTAAELLNTSQPSLSRSIQLLEERLGIKLFHRHARGLTLTDQGEHLVPIIGQFLSKLETATEKLYEEEKEPKGSLRVVATGGLINLFILPYIPGFLERYPEIRLTLIASDAIPALEFGEAHVVIRPPISFPDAGDIIQKHILTNHVGLYASKEYLEKFGTPSDPKDLDSHRLVAFGDHPEAAYFAPMNWHLTLGTDPGEMRQPFLQVNSPQARFAMAKAGTGIIALSKEHPGLEESDLIQVLPHIPGPVVESYYIYPKELENSKKVIAFQHYLEDVFNRDYKKEKINIKMVKTF